MLKRNHLQSKADSHRRASAPHRLGQAAVELAVFGAILIFILGSIVRSAVGNSYSQNQSYKAMRMAMLSSWRSSQAGATARNSASVLIVEDRLSPDANKYGSLDRQPFIAMGSGSFSTMMLYPVDLSDYADGYAKYLPIMDVYINGQYFPFTQAALLSKTITQPVVCNDPPGSCQQNQCLRNQREWVVGSVSLSQFKGIVPVTTATVTAEDCLNKANDAAKRTCQDQANANDIINMLYNAGLIRETSTNPPKYADSPLVSSMPRAGSPGAMAWQMFTTAYGAEFSANSKQLNLIKTILLTDNVKYKLFYTIVPNGTAEFGPNAPKQPAASCISGVCTRQALTSDLPLLDYNGNPTTDGTGNDTNANALMQYDLLRNADYSAVAKQFPTVPSCLTNAGTSSLRCNIAWQWTASLGVVAGDTSNGADTAIGLDPASNTYPTYDIDGRLKEVTIYYITQNFNGTPTVVYEDYQGGDIDATWDINSCSPKPGMQSSSQILSFAKDGTYLVIKEGHAYNPQTGQVVQSTNKRNSINLIQREFQLSNNTGRFCTKTSPPSPLDCVGGTCPAGVSHNNPVEVCVDATGCPVGPYCSCFSTQQNIKSTCMDVSTSHPMLFIRSRLEDRRGSFWWTDATGKLKVQ